MFPEFLVFLLEESRSRKRTLERVVLQKISSRFFCSFKFLRAQLCLQKSHSYPEFLRRMYGSMHGKYSTMYLSCTAEHVYFT